MEDRVDNRDLPMNGHAECESHGPGLTRGSALRNMPLRARREFPRLEVATGRDLHVIGGQLGRTPRGEVFVACRCEFGRPSVLLTLWDLLWRGPVPPLLWLSCPHLVRQVSGMESRGTIRRYADALKGSGADEREKQLFVEGEEQFGQVQALISAVRVGTPADRLERRGVAGGPPGAVKCLHAHLAYRLASGRGIVGGWCLQELDNRGGRICERIPEACLT
jgi:hypothetical protein